MKLKQNDGESDDDFTARQKVEDDREAAEASATELNEIRRKASEYDNWQTEKRSLTDQISSLTTSLNEAKNSTEKAALQTELDGLKAELTELKKTSKPPTRKASLAQKLPGKEGARPEARTPRRALSRI